MHWIAKKRKEAQAWLALVLTQGDFTTRHLEGTLGNQLDVMARDVYQAMLARFRSSSFCSTHIVQSYRQMFSEPVQMGYHTMCALIDCQRRIPFEAENFRGHLSTKLQALINRMYQLKDRNLNLLIQGDLGCVEHASKSLKYLVKRKAEYSHVKLVWNSIQSTFASRRIVRNGCSAPRAVLNSLVLEHGMSVKGA